MCTLPTEYRRKRATGWGALTLTLLLCLCSAEVRANCSEYLASWSTNILPSAQDGLPAFFSIVYFLSSLVNQLNINSFKKLFLTCSGYTTFSYYCYYDNNNSHDKNNDDIIFENLPWVSRLHILHNIVFIRFSAIKLLYPVLQNKHTDAN